MPVRERVLQHLLPYVRRSRFKCIGREKEVAPRRGQSIAMSGAIRKWCEDEHFKTKAFSYAE